MSLRALVEQAAGLDTTFSLLDPRRYIETERSNLLPEKARLPRRLRHLAMTSILQIANHRLLIYNFLNHSTKRAQAGHRSWLSAIGTWMQMESRVVPFRK